MSASTIGLGVDSFLACLAIAPLVPRVGDRVLLAGVLGTADMCATLAASHGGVAVATMASLILLAALAVAVVSPGSRRVSVLPVLLSIDNLLTPLPPGDAVVAGVTSGALAVAGFATATLLARAVPGRLQVPVAITAAIVAVTVMARG